jgi:hypothetical protein
MVATAVMVQFKAGKSAIVGIINGEKKKMTISRNLKKQ